MKRFPRVFFFLVISLFLAISGVDKALDQMANSPSQSILTVYNADDSISVAYTGNFFCFKAPAKTGSQAPGYDLHRG